MDIAHLGGGETAGSVVCFIDGKPFKPSYRRYKVRTTGGGDDYAAIREVVYRRYQRAGVDEELFEGDGTETSPGLRNLVTVRSGERTVDGRGAPA